MENNHPVFGQKVKPERVTKKVKPERVTWVAFKLEHLTSLIDEGDKIVRLIKRGKLKKALAAMRGLVAAFKELLESSAEAIFAFVDE